MLADAVKSLIEYNDAAHRRLWQSIDRLTDEQFTHEIDYSMGSVRNHMVHVISADRRWIARVTGDQPPERLDPMDFSTCRTAYDQWQEVERQVFEAVAVLDDHDMIRTITYEVTRSSGVKIQATNTLWQILVHMTNHGTDHRAQVLPILHRLGAPTFEQDFMIYLWEQHG